MKGKNGFTLVELLAVIVILGLLMVIIAPKITNTLNESEKKTNMASAQNLVKAAEYKIANNEVKGIKENTIIDYSNNTNTNYLDYSGAKPEIGKVQIRFNGAIAMSVKFGDYCYTKGFDSEEIITTSYNVQTCGSNADVFMNYEIPQITQSGDGLYESTTEYGRLIYRGSNPDNYITLKENNVDTTYRIVSYETDGTIKVVRNEKLEENRSYDNNTTRNNSNNTFCTLQNAENNGNRGCNVWGNMNNTYYNGKTLGQQFYYKYYDSIWKKSGGIGTVTQDSSLNTYLNTTWINTLDFKDNIIVHEFNVGGIYYYRNYPTGDKGIKKEKEEEGIYKWYGKIALLNITEYVESSTNQNCTNVWSNFAGNPQNSSTNSGPCQDNNYNLKGYYQRSLTPYLGNTFETWFFGDETYKYCADSSAYVQLANRPAFYLKSSTKLGGSGTSTNPYYIIES